MKKSVVLTFFSCMLCFFSFAQSTKIDSLKSSLIQTKSDSSRVKILKDISWEYLNNRNDGDKAKAYIDSVYILSQKANLDWGISLANYQYCVYERQKGNYNRALNYIEKYLNFSHIKSDEKAYANGLYQKAIILDDKGNQEEALKIYYNVLKIYQERGDTYGVGFTLNALAEILKKIDKIDEAIESYNKALNIFTLLDNKIELANVNYNLGDAYMQLKDYDKALNFFNKALTIDEELKSDWGMAYDYTSLGKVANLKGDYNQALTYHLKALDLRKKLNQQRELVLSYNEIGKTYLNLKEYIKAESFLTKSVEITENIGVKTEMKDAYKILSSLYTETNDYKKALEYNNKFIAIKDSLFNETKSKQIEELQARFDLEKKQDEITSLEKDAQIKDLKLKRQATLRNIIIGITLAVILLSFILFKRYQYKQQLKQEELEKKQLIAKADAEKERIIELQKVDRLKDEFLANTSHELRTPLTGIIGLTESLKDGIAGNLPAVAIENLDLIANSGKRLTHLVNDILDFSKLKNKDLVLHLRPTDLYPLVNIVLKLSAPLLKFKKIELNNNIPKDFPLVQADENRLQQILYNLIGNAIKFTNEGQIEITAKKENDKVIVEVSDTGIGIAKEKNDIVFQPFEHGENPNVREQGGTGLGLTVTKQLVELHGGTITFESEVAKGTTFRFTLTKSTSKRVILKEAAPDFDPQLQHIQETPLAATKQAAPTVKLTANALKVLIVDDEHINRKVLENHLSLSGYISKEAVNGKEALSFIKQGDAFDLILLDIMMPGMSGYTVCESIREKYSASELPIILLTAKNRVNDLVTGFNAGANDYLTKPFSKNELLSRIKTHINLKNIHNATSKFIPTEFLKSIEKETITDVTLGDHTEKEITVLFTDIRGYTHLAEGMTPEQNFKFVNAYVSRMGPLIQQNRGFVNQYLGDGIMALFPHQPNHALQGAIDMQKKIRTYNKRRIADGYSPIEVGMGIHSGPLVMGIIGDVKRNDTAIIADTVNTAARMEGLTKHFGANIIVSGNSLQKIENKKLFNLRYLGKVKVKGKEHIVDIFECFDGDTNEQIRFKKITLADFNKALAHFFKKEFSEAYTLFENIASSNPDDSVTAYFKNKSKKYLEKLPHDWEGVNLMDQK